MALQRVRSLAATRFKTDAEANEFTPAFGELVTVFEKGGYRGLRIGDGSTTGGLSVGEYILPIIAKQIQDGDTDSIGDTGTDTAPVVDTGLSWAQQQTEQLGEATVASELFDATFYGMNSLYFDGSSSLQKTFDADGSKTTWTFSTWVKPRTFEYQGIFEANHKRDDQTSLSFENAGTLVFTDRPGNNRNIDVRPTQVFRDIGWTHIVTTVDTTNSRVDLYIDGVRVTDFATSTYPSENYEIAYWNKGGISHKIGCSQGNSTAYFEGHMANIQFIDGMALDAGYFGKYLGANWVPKVYEGAYGANGFWLDFSDTEFDDSTGNLVTVKDVAPIEGAHTTANDWSAAA